MLSAHPSRDVGGIRRVLTGVDNWAKRGTEVTTRVRIDDETGAVAKGALWTEESLPAESLLWSLALVHNSRKPLDKEKKTAQPPAAELMQGFSQQLGARSRIFLGGDRTIGRGLCGLHLLQKGA